MYRQGQNGQIARGGTEACGRAIIRLEQRPTTMWHATQPSGGTRTRRPQTSPSPELQASRNRLPVPIGSDPTSSIFYHRPWPSSSRQRCHHPVILRWRWRSMCTTWGGTASWVWTSWTTATLTSGWMASPPPELSPHLTLESHEAMSFSDAGATTSRTPHGRVGIPLLDVWPERYLRRRDRSQGHRTSECRGEPVLTMRRCRANL
jgi:hypothetical protein